MKKFLRLAIALLTLSLSTICDSASLCLADDLIAYEHLKSNNIYSFAETGQNANSRDFETPLLPKDSLVGVWLPDQHLRRN